MVGTALASTSTSTSDKRVALLGRDGRGGEGAASVDCEADSGDRAMVALDSKVVGAGGSGGKVKEMAVREGVRE